MNKLSHLLAVAAILSLLLGLSGAGKDGLSGFAIALGAVMFILAFIARVFGAESIN